MFNIYRILPHPTGMFPLLLQRMEPSLNKRVSHWGPMITVFVLQECTHGIVCPDICSHCQMRVTLSCIQNIMALSLLGNFYLPNRDERGFICIYAPIKFGEYPVEQLRRDMGGRRCL